jgi:hypothetical protein
MIWQTVEIQVSIHNLPTQQEVKPLMLLCR